MSAQSFLSAHLANLTEAAKVSDLQTRPAGTPGPANAPVQANAAMTNMANGLQPPASPKPPVHVPGQSIPGAALDHLAVRLPKALTGEETADLQVQRSKFPEAMRTPTGAEPADHVEKRNYVQQQGGQR